MVAPQELENDDSNHSNDNHSGDSNDNDTATKNKQWELLRRCPGCLVIIVGDHVGV